MSLFNFRIEELLSFFGVLVRYSTLFAVLPLVGDRSTPAMIKILFGLVTSIALFPALISSGAIHSSDALVWGQTASGIISTVVLEALFGFVMGYTARLVFDGVSMGANLMGNFMGFASASVYDPHQESQTEVVAQIQTTLAMLIFLALDGHHLMLKASLDSYRMVGMGRAGLNAALSYRLVQMSTEVFKFGVQLAAPVAVALFSVNVVFGVLAKSMPQLNILVLSFSVSALVGFIVMFLGAPGFVEQTGDLVTKIQTWMEAAMRAMAGD